MAAAAVGAMVVAVLAGLLAGGFGDEGATLLSLTWGRITLVDAYVAFGLGWGWIALRERSVAVAAAWLVAVALLGSLALGVYLLAASTRAADVPTLLLGDRHPDRTGPIR